jgi:SAM-dependent methyltransferase
MIAHPTLRTRLYLLGRRLRTRGLQGTAGYYFGRLTTLLQGGRDEQADAQAVGLEPSLTQAGLDIPRRNAKWGAHYAPSREDIFTKAVGTLPIRFGEYRFIDLGAGKGDMLLSAARLGFKSVVGVEYSKALAAIASANLSSAADAMRGRMECVWGDATEFDLPNDRAVIDLFNPFQGRVMDTVVRNIEHSLRTVPRDV